MAVLLAEYRVEDLGAFKVVFDEFAPIREEHGAISHRLLASTTDPRVVDVLIEFPTAEAAAAFAADPRRGDALWRAGVVERVDRVLEEIESAVS
jgi:hypothetical protein